MTTEVELRTEQAVVLPPLSILLTIIIAQSAYIASCVERRVDDVTKTAQNHETRITRVETGRESDKALMAHLFDSMDRHFNMVRDGHGELRDRYGELRKELRSIRDKLDLDG